MDFRRLFDIFPYQQTRYPNKIALAQWENDKWKAYDTTTCLDYISQVSAGLLKLGIHRGDKVAIMTFAGSPQWTFFDLGAQQLGAIVVPLHANLDQEELQHIIKDAQVKCCVVENKEMYENLKTIQTQQPQLKYLFSLDSIKDVPHFNELLSIPTDDDLEAFEGLRAAVHEDDLVTIIYTSGTTGLPKGVMLSHKNIVSNVKSIIPLIPINCDHRGLSFLPMSHILRISIWLLVLQFITPRSQSTLWRLVNRFGHIILPRYPDCSRSYTMESWKKAVNMASYVDGSFAGRCR